MKKRKHDRILDSDASDSDDPLGTFYTSFLPQSPTNLTFNPADKLAKLDKDPHPRSQSPQSPSSLALRLFPSPPPPSTNPPEADKPTSPQDPYAGLTPLQRKLKDEKFIKVRTWPFYSFSNTYIHQYNVPIRYLHSTRSQRVHQQRAPLKPSTSRRTRCFPLDQ